MGTWGSGNFDSDGALDYMGEIMDGLGTRIENTFADESLSYLDEYGEAVIVPSVAVMSVLCEQCHAVPPQAVTVTQWKTQYLTLFDDQIEGLGGSAEFNRERRATVVSTFERLEEQARAFWRDGE